MRGGLAGSVGGRGKRKRPQGGTPAPPPRQGSRGPSSRAAGGPKGEAAPGHRRSGPGDVAVARATLTNRYGLHMRPAKQVAELANSFPCDITLVTDEQEADAKSILSVIGLGAECGDEVAVRARGEKASEAAGALAELLRSLPELHGEPEDA